MNCLFEANIISQFYFPFDGTTSTIQYRYNENTFFDRMI